MIVKQPYKSKLNETHIELGRTLIWYIKINLKNWKTLGNP